jgi:hypothetical protein
LKTGLTAFICLLSPGWLQNIRVGNYFVLLILFWACFSQLALAEEGPSLSLPVDIKANTKNQDSELSKHVNRIKDLKLTIQIRKILSEDAELSQLNIGVSVKDGILRLWGPVPDSLKMEKSLKKVANVKLIFDIKNEMYIGVLEDIPEPLFIKE